MDLVVASNTEDSLIDQLSFKLPSTASYGTERRLVSGFPSGASEFSPNGVRVARFVLTGEWLDPASLRVAFKIRNTGNQPLQLVGGCHVLIDQIRVFAGGTEIEKIGPYYGRTHELFRHLLMPNAWNIETTVEDGQQYDPGVYPQVSPKLIGPSQYLSVTMQPLLGITSMDKYLPLRFLGGLTIELTLANSEQALHPNSASQTYQLEQMEMRMSQVTLDSALNNSFSQLLLQGRALQFHYKTIHLQQQALPANNTECQVSMVRSLSRLAGLFISFTGPPTYADELGNQLDTPANQRHLHKSFLNPSAFITGAPIGVADEALLNWQVQIGAKSWPEGQPASNLSETFSLFRQSIGIYDESLRTTSITEAGYRLNQFCIGVPMKIVNQPFSSVNMRSGDLLTIRVNNLNGDVRQAGRIFVHMVAEQIFELRESGVQVMD
jgi:hypothetical protein